MADLPQELIDKIIDEVAQDSSTSLLCACSLVQKRWVGRSRRHIFRSLTLYRLDDFIYWIKSFPPGPNSLHHHVRQLSYRQGGSLLGPRQLLNIYPNHFTSFTRLETLQMFNLSLQRFTSASMKKAFGPVGSSVRTLVIKDVELTLNSLLVFLLHFPRLQALELGYNLNILAEKTKRPPNLPNLTGELFLLSVGPALRSLILELSKLPLRFSELDVGIRWTGDVLNAFAHLILTCSPTLEKLTLRYTPALFDDGTLNTPFSDLGSTHTCSTGLLTDANEAFPIDLKSCSLLRNVTIQVPKREAEEHLVRLLGTIRSRKLEKIEFIGPADSIQPSAWAMVDGVLCALVDGLKEYGWKGKLRAVIHRHGSGGEIFDESRLLAEFTDKGGVVESVDDGPESLLRSDWFV